MKQSYLTGKEIYDRIKAIMEEVKELEEACYLVKDKVGKGKPLSTLEEVLKRQKEELVRQLETEYEEKTNYEVNVVGDFLSREN